MSEAGDSHRSQTPQHPVQLVGLDAASQHSKFGYALGRIDPDTSTVVVEHAGLLGDADDPLRNRVAPFVRGGGRVLVAITGECAPPDETHFDQIKREGWIWVRRNAEECADPTGPLKPDRRAEPT